MNWLRVHWRRILAIAPLPALGLAASYGVYRFALLFVPGWVAVVQAASFELTYIGLAVVDGLTAPQRRRAQWIGVGAVAVSVLYNSLDGLFHRRPQLLAEMPLGGEVALAVLHGLPLAVVAYLVSNLLLHAASVSESQKQAEPGKTDADLAGPGRAREYSLEDVRQVLAGETHAKRSDLVERLGCSPATASRLIADALQDGYLTKNGAGYVVNGG